MFIKGWDEDDQLKYYFFKSDNKLSWYSDFALAITAITTCCSIICTMANVYSTQYNGNTIHNISHGHVYVPWLVSFYCM